MLKRDSLEKRIVDLVASRYPITVREAARELKVSLPRVERALKRLASQGIVHLEVLPDRTYIRLLRIPSPRIRDTDPEGMYS